MQNVPVSNQEPRPPSALASQALGNILYKALASAHCPVSISEILPCCLIHALGFAQLLNHQVTLSLINESLKLCFGATKVYWVENYFEYREQAVKIGNMFPSIKLIAAGNPCGIHLEPCFFYFAPLLMTQLRFVKQQMHNCVLMV